MNRMDALYSFLESIKKNDVELVSEITNAASILFEASTELSNYNRKADSLYGTNPKEAFKYYKKAQATAKPKSRDFLYATGGITRILADQNKKEEALLELKKLPENNSYRRELETELQKQVQKPTRTKESKTPSIDKKQITPSVPSPVKQTKQVETASDGEFTQYVLSLPDDDVFKKTMMAISPSKDIEFYNGIIPPNASGLDAVISMMSVLEEDSRKKQFATAFGIGNKKDANTLLKKMPENNAKDFILALKGSKEATDIAMRSTTGVGINESYGLSKAAIEILWASIFRPSIELRDKYKSVAFQYKLARNDFIKLADSKGMSEEEYFKITLGTSNAKWFKSPEQALSLCDKVIEDSAGIIEKIIAIQKDMSTAVKAGVNLDDSFLFSTLSEKKDDMLALIADVFGAGGIFTDDEVEKLFGIRQNGMIYIASANERRDEGGFMNPYTGMPLENMDIRVYPGTSMLELPESVHIGRNVDMQTLISKGVKTRLYQLGKVVTPLSKEWYPKGG